MVAEALIEKFKPIREEINHLMASPEYLEEVLDTGSQRATLLAEITWLDVRQRVGFDILARSNRMDLSNITSLS